MLNISFCFETVTWVYICVMLIELCPSMSCIYRISTPASRRLVANVWRNICGVMCISIPAIDAYLFIILRTDWSDSCCPCCPVKKTLGTARFILNGSFILFQDIYDALISNIYKPFFSSLSIYHDSSGL